MAPGENIFGNSIRSSSLLLAPATSSSSLYLYLLCYSITDEAVAGFHHLVANVSGNFHQASVTPSPLILTVPPLPLIPFKLAAVVANRIHSTRDSLGMDLGKVTHNEQKVAVKSL